MKGKGTKGNFANIFIDVPKKPKGKQYLVDMLDDYLYSLNENAAFNRKRVDGKISRIWRPSQLEKVCQAGCVRKLVFAHLDAEHEEGSFDVDAKLRRIFDNGSGVHERLQQYLAELEEFTKSEVSLQGVWKCKNCHKVFGESKFVGKPKICSDCNHDRFKYKEAPFGIDSLNIQGTADGIIKWGKDVFLLEIKSMNSHVFDRTVKVPDYYLPQVNMYMKGHGVGKCLFWCENKNTQEIKEFIVSYDPKVIESHLKLVKEANKYINKKIVPQCNKCTIRHGLEYCKTCEFKTICKLDVPFKYDVRIKDCGVTNYG